MARRDVSVTVGLCVSLGVHAIFALSLIFLRIKDLDRSVRAAKSRAGLQFGAGEEVQPIFEPPRLDAPADDADLRRWTHFGEVTGKGEAPNSSPGAAPLMATKAPQAQAYLSLDPEGPGPRHTDPSESLLPPGMNGDGRKPARGGLSAARAGASMPPSPPATAILTPFGPSEVPAQAQPLLRAGRLAQYIPQPLSPLPAVSDLRPVEEGALAPTRPTETAIAHPPTTLPLNLPIVRHPQLRTIEGDSTVDPLTTPKPAPQSPQLAIARAQSQSPRSQTPSGPSNDAAAPSGTGPAGPPIAAADPAPKSESESDAFAREGSVRFQNGKLEARLGRRFKSVNPRLGLKAGVDTTSIFNPSVVLRVRIDPTGRITDVRTLHSSGSSELDQATESALYKWWIEPAKDTAGNPRPDVILITFSYI